MQNRRRLGNGLAFLLAAAGLGLCGYAGLQWRELPHYTDAEIAASADLNLALDLAREQSDTQAPANPAPLEDRRRAMQTEVRAELAHAEGPVRAWFFAGLALLGIAAVRTWLLRRSTS